MIGVEFDIDLKLGIFFFYIRLNYVSNYVFV